MEQSNNNQHIVDIPTTSSSGSNNNNSSSTTRGEGQRRWGLFSSGLWIYVELVLTVSQIIASIIVLVLSRHEHPRAPLFSWIVGYASGCFASLPLLYRRYQVSQQESAQSQQVSARISLPGVSFTVSVSRNSEVEECHDRTSVASNARLKTLVEYLKMALSCFFAIWFVVGNMWTFGVHSSSSDAPIMYRLCVVFLTYAMPFILCATIFCYLPCIISHLGVGEHMRQTRGATAEAINALPTYKYKLNKKQNGQDNNSVAGTVAAGTENERSISGEDAVCCICLAKYANNDELRELPCLHFFHKECVGKWLKINASCPLCKKEISGSGLGSNSDQQRAEGA